VRGSAPPGTPTAEGGASAGAADVTATGPYRRLRTCVICTRPYEGEDLAHCPAYQGPICSLCCSLDARCEDLCKPEATLRAQWNAALHRLMPRSWATSLDTGLAHYLLLMGVVTPLLAGLFGLLYREESRRLTAEVAPALAQAVTESLWLSYVKAFSALLLTAGVVCWWLVLTHRSRQVAQEESNRQTEALHRQAQVLQQEITSHQRTDAMLQAAKHAAEAAQAQAEQANRAKSRYITTISHELRTPLNSILGYAQLLEEDAAMPAHRRHAVSVIRRGGDHLLGLIEGTLDIARIESGRFSLEPRPMRFAQTVAEIAAMFELQAAAQGIAFRHEVQGRLPEWVRADDKRLRQILINVLGNAVKFTREGQVRFTVSHSRELARFEIADTGPGMTADELERVFEPFERGRAAGPSAPGTGLGLTISKMLTELMGGELSATSAPGQGTTFRITLFLAALDGTPAGGTSAMRGVPVGYAGERRRLLVVDNEEADRELLRHWLEPIGFEVETAASGEEGLARADRVRPHAVMLDLAMPGIDGWETLRRLRAHGATDVPVAIVSANAFDKSLENDLGITPYDFLVKPVRHGDLLEWLERRLALAWVVPDPTPAPASGPRRHGAPDAAGPLDDVPHREGPAAATPSAARALQRLQEAARIGHLRGVLSAIAALGESGALSADEVAAYGDWARQFRFDPLAAELARRLAATGAVSAAQDP
jgi:signal transduction histidine kinase/CheY-like chemotaxis protein